MRGTLWGGEIGLHIDGIIPAYAGNTCKLLDRYRRRRDHPRVCGEHSVSKMVCEAQAGSSPRMRGTRGTPVVGFVNAGIIPAYAGNTKLLQGILICLGDHPRVCGEHHLSCMTKG